ncbi:MAG: hypothetical protein AAGU12_09585 [Clostridiales bacterium]
MNRILRHPAANGICISLFSAFYALIFIITSGHREFTNLLYYSRHPQISSFWGSWSGFLAAGRHAYIAYGLLAITILVVILLFLRRRAYDEYHTALLIQCLIVALVLTLIAIAAFFLIILSDANGIVEKFTLFITIHWATVVLADFTYVTLCRWK